TLNYGRNFRAHQMHPTEGFLNTTFTFISLARSVMRYNAKMNTFAFKLRELRLQKNLLLRQVAAAVEVDTSMVSKFENGERSPTREQIEKLAGFFQIPVKEFLVDAYSDKLAHDLSCETFAIEILRCTIDKLKSKE